MPENINFLNTTTNKIIVKRKKQDKNNIIKCKICKDLMTHEFMKYHHCFSKVIEKPTQSNTKKRKVNETIDLEKQCGVQIIKSSDSNNNFEEVKLCRNGFTCKLHSLEEKRKVEGRLYSVDILIKMANEERKRRKYESKNKEKEIEINEDNSEKGNSGDIKGLNVLDDEIMKIMNDIKPVVKKHWYLPRIKNEEQYLRNIFTNRNNEELRRFRR